MRAAMIRKLNGTSSHPGSYEQQQETKQQPSFGDAKEAKQRWKPAGDVSSELQEDERRLSTNRLFLIERTKTS